MCSTTSPSKRCVLNRARAHVKKGEDMFRHAIPIGTMWGTSVDLDYSWFLVFGLLTWVLAVSYYPTEFKQWSTAGYWFMGAFTAVMFFVCVLVHELGHSVVAKRYKIPAPRIALFIFGGVSETPTESLSSRVELWIATAGPIVSFVLALTFRELQPFLVSVRPLFALAKYLAVLNFMLGVLNLVPGLPLDGGRVLRSIIWSITGNFRRSNALATVTGRIFGFSFVVGVFGKSWLEMR